MTGRTLIAVVSCALYPQRRAAIRETWAAQPLPPGTDLLFFRGINPVEVYEPAEPGLVILLAADDYTHLPEKTYALAMYAVERGYTRLIKVDDDTYLRLPDALSALHGADCIAFKRDNPPHNARVPYPQGGCYALSERSLLAVVSEPGLFSTGLEDAAVGRALNCHGIEITHSPRIKTDYRLGKPQPDNDIVATHHCGPDMMRSIHAGTFKGDLLCSQR